MELLIQGLQNKQIADKLGVALRTVKAFKSQILERTNSQTACEAVAKYIYAKHDLLSQ